MIEKNSTKSNEFLDITTLNYGDYYSRHAYLYNVKAGNTVNEDGFFTLMLKDANGNLVTGRMFNVVEYNKSGLEMLALKGKPVTIYFRVDQFNGSLNLIVTSIELYKGIFDYEGFLGKIRGIENSKANLETTLRQILGQAEYKLPIQYSTKSLPNIYEGRCGGYIKLLEMALTNLISCKGLPSVDFKELLTTFVIVQEHYFKYLSRVADIDYIENSMKLDFMLGIMKHDDTKSTDTLGSLMGLNQPETLTSVLIYDSIKDAQDKINLTCKYEKLVTGFKSEIGGRYLLKY